MIRTLLRRIWACWELTMNESTLVRHGIQREVIDMRPLFLLTSVLIVGVLLAPNHVHGQKKPTTRTIVGAISAFECGDNCYLTITDDKGKAHVGLCAARTCDAWNDETEIPQSEKGKRVKVTVGKGNQYDGSGRLVGKMDAFTTIQFLAISSAAKNANSISGVYRSGTYGTLVLKEIGTGDPRSFTFKIDLATNFCSGGIEGTADWITKTKAESRVKNDLYDASNEYDAPFCELTFVFAGKKIFVDVKNEAGCTSFHGVRGCSFGGVTFLKR